MALCTHGTKSVFNNKQNHYIKNKRERERDEEASIEVNKRGMSDVAELWLKLVHSLIG